MLELEEIETSGDGLQRAQGETFAYIPKEYWKLVVKAGIESVLLEIAGKGDFRQFESVAWQHGVVVVGVSPPDESEVVF